MSLFFADLVREASWGTGTGDLPLEGALPGHRRFADAAPPGARFHYCIAGVTHPDEWETGEGEIGSGGTLIRLPLASSASPATGPGQAEPVDFSAGLKTVALTVTAYWFATREDGATISNVAGLQGALDGKQPLDGTLTAIAGLAGTADSLPYFTAEDAVALTGFPAFGRTLVTNASAAGARSDLVISAVNTPFTPAGNIAASDVQAALEELDGKKQPLDSELTAIAALTTTAYGRGALELADASALRTYGGLIIGADVQAHDAELAAIAELTSDADRLPYFIGSGTASLATFTAFGRSLVDDADAATARTTLGVTAAGADTTYAYRANNLSDLASASTARTNLGLGTIATQPSSSVSITGGAISGLSSLSVTGALSCTGGATIGGILSVTGSGGFNIGTLGGAPRIDYTDSAFNFLTGAGAGAAITAGSGSFSDTISSSGLGSFAGLRTSGPTAARFEDTGNALPSGSTGLGVEIFNFGSVSYVQSYNRSTSTYGSLRVGGSSIALYVDYTDRAVISSAGLAVTGTLSINGSQALTSRRGGWAAPTGTATRTSFATATVTTAQLAERVKALIDDLTAHGLIGS